MATLCKDIVSKNREVVELLVEVTELGHMEGDVAQEVNRRFNIRDMETSEKLKALRGFQKQMKRMYKALNTVRTHGKRTLYVPATGATLSLLTQWQILKMGRQGLSERQIKNVLIGVLKRLTTTEPPQVKKTMFVGVRGFPGGGFPVYEVTQVGQDKLKEPV